MIVRIFGPPGTGKTYMLNRIVYHLIGVENNSPLLGEYGLQLPFRAYKMSQIAYISFMNSAVDELLNRLDVKRDYCNGPWGTLHGLALHLLIRDKLVPKELVANTFAGRGGLYYWRRKFTYEVGIPYDPQEEVRTLLGNQLFDALSYAVNVYYPKYEDMSRVLDKLYDITDNPELVQYAEAWERFKVQNKIIDFDDILVLTYTARPALDAPVLVVDEFQDFGPLQYEIFKAWAEGRDFTIVSGDDDQVVTEYNGSDPRFLVELPGLGSDFDVVLKQSFRIPQVVHEASQRFIKTYVRYRYPKEFLPRDAQGIFVVLKQPLPHILRFVKKVAQSGQSVLILARTNALVRDIERMLLTEGIEYHRYKARVTQVWRDFINRIHAVVKAVKAGKKVRETDLRFFFRFTRVPEEKVNAIAKAFASGNVPLEAYRIFDDPLKVLDFGRVAEFLGSQEKADMALRALKALLDGKVQRPKAPIYLDTIHAAKGREADVVVLFDTITPRIFDGIRQDRGSFESEMRVWYVGMTRARKALIVVPLDIPLALPLLRKAGFSSMKVLA